MSTLSEEMSLKEGYLPEEEETMYIFVYRQQGPLKDFSGAADRHHSVGPAEEPHTYDSLEEMAWLQWDVLLDENTSVYKLEHVPFEEYRELCEGEKEQEERDNYNNH